MRSIREATRVLAQRDEVKISEIRLVQFEEVKRSQLIAVSEEEARFVGTSDSQACYIPNGFYKQRNGVTARSCGVVLVW